MAQLDEIAAFVAVVERGSFKAAAASLGLSVSVVSRRLHALEERLRAQLLHRTTRRVRLSDAGRELYEHVREVPRKIEEAEERIRARSARPSGALSVVMPSYFASSGFHHRVIPEFLAAHPDVQLTFLIASEPTEHLGEDFDVVVAGKLPSQRFPDTSMVGRKLHEFHAQLFATPAYLEQHGRPKHPRDLLQHNCLSYTNRRWFFRDPKSKEEIVIEVAGTLTTNSNAVLWAAVMNGIGVGYSFPYFFDNEVAAGKVETVLDTYTKRAWIDIWAFHPAQRFVPRRTRTFLEMLRAHFEKGS